jgi:hypothetical protein
VLHKIGQDEVAVDVGHQLRELLGDIKEVVDVEQLQDEKVAFFELLLRILFNLLLVLWWRDVEFEVHLNERLV